jgi:glycosyltransferase involved in cell wall biosynthesis
MNPLRVALFTDSDVFAGTERHMIDLALGLRAAGVEVCLACPIPSALAERAAGAGLPVVKIQKRGLLDYAAIRTLAALLKSGTIDLVHSHNGRTALLSAVAVTLAGRGRAVATQHFLEPGHLVRSGVKAFASRVMHRWVNRQTSGFIAISEAAKAGMLDRGQAPAEHISVVPNGMPPADPARLAPSAQIRAELGIAPGAALIVAVARLEREKSLGTLIAAMKSVAAADPSAVCVIVGDGSRRAALLSQIAGGGLGDAVKLIGFRADALALMNAADIFVLPSLNEAFGLVLIEAMSVGKPVVATRSGGPLEIVVDGGTGLLVAPGAADEMGRAILSLVRDAAWRRRMGEAGRVRFLEKFTVERMTRATIEAYGKALAA